jgi:hypothetical protein
MATSTRKTNTDKRRSNGASAQSTSSANGSRAKAASAGTRSKKSQGAQGQARTRRSTKPRASTAAATRATRTPSQGNGTRSRSKKARSGGGSRTAASASKPVSNATAPLAGASSRTKILTGAAAGLAGTAVIGVAGRAASQRTRRRRVLGIAIPDELRTHTVDAARLVARIDLQDVMRRIGDAAEQVEAFSDDVRIWSSQAKRLSRGLS